MTKIYKKNEDEQFCDIINSLKQLPKVGASPDFEMNLKRRINSLEHKKKRSFFYYFTLRRSLVPTLALSAVVIITLLLTNRNSQVENQLTTVPELKADSGQSSGGNSLVKEHLIKPENIRADNVIIKKSDNHPSDHLQKQSEATAPADLSAEEQSVASSQKNNAKQLDFGQPDNDLDKSLHAKPDPDGGAGQYDNPGSNVNFGGFNFIPEYDQDTDQLRARMDSLNKLRHR
ncbi:MAG: hypothetical protein WCJ01_04315 [Ignavibacteria bacterium]